MLPATDAPHNGTRTSVIAAESITRNYTEQLRADILAFLRRRPALGATADEIEMLMEIPGNTLRPRLVEMRRRSLIRDSGQTRRTRTGRPAAVWVVA